jgi:hypothetical protein
MQLSYTGHVVRSEWRWLFLVSIILILLIIAPLLIVALRSLETNNWQFMGALVASTDTSALLSRMLQGAHGNWLQTFQFTPDRHQGVLIQLIYAMLGAISRPNPSAVIVMFHLARLISGMLMFVAIYQLGANIWVKIRTRRIFFVVASLGTGWGWVFLLLQSDITSIDFTAPQASAFYSAMTNVHFPLTIAALAVLAAIIVGVLRPGNHEEPNVKNVGVVAFFVSLGLAFLYPEAFIPLGSAVLGSILAQWWNRGFHQREIRWGLWILVPALPIIAYYIITFSLNDAVASWIAQRGAVLVSVFDILIGLGFLSLIALPGLWRAVRYFEADGDRFMILWLGSMVLFAILPLGLSHIVLVGLILPVAYFVTRSIEDFWFQFIARRHRRYVYVVVTLLIALGNFYTLILPIVPILQLNRGTYATLDPAYVPALTWISEHTQQNDVVLASPRVSRWVPLWANARTYYGHPYETRFASERREDVLRWYREQDVNQCNDVLYWRPVVGNVYPIRYVILGPSERALGQTVCVDDLSFVASFDDVTIYTTALSNVIP